jgi:hypothetical protein
MRSKVQPGSRTYPLAISRSITPVDHWTFGGVAHSLENGCLPRICSSNNEHSELDIAGDSGGKDLLFSHSAEVRRM